MEVVMFFLIGIVVGFFVVMLLIAIGVIVVGD